MKKHCAGLIAILFSLVAVGLGNPVMFNGGVIDSRTTVTQIDSATLTTPDMTFYTPGWGSTPFDTFILGGVAGWPANITLHGTVNGIAAHPVINQPCPDTWYRIGFGVVTSFVEFGEYPDPGAIEEPNPLAGRPLSLAVSPSVVTGQMAIRLRPIGTGRQAVEMHDVVGNVVRSLDCATGSDGVATATWNREDKFGRLVPEGVYFCRYASGDAIAVQKVLVAH
jgi:hypothetical protein